MTVYQSGYFALPYSRAPAAWLRRQVIWHSKREPTGGLTHGEKAVQLWQKLEFKNFSVLGQIHDKISFMEPPATRILAVGPQGSAPSGHILIWASNISPPPQPPNFLSDEMEAFSVAGVLV